MSRDPLIMVMEYQFIFLLVLFVIGLWCARQERRKKQTGNHPKKGMMPNESTIRRPDLARGPSERAPRNEKAKGKA